MAHTQGSGGQLPDDVDVALEDGGTSHEDSSSRVERFGLGVAASILLGGVVGVAATWSLGGDGTPLLVSLGLGFLLSPIVGLLVLQRGD